MKKPLLTLILVAILVAVGFKIYKAMTVEVPADSHIATLREQFMEFCDHMNLDAVIEPVKI